MKAHPVVLVFAMCLVVLLSFCQEPKLVLPIGHTSIIISTSFSPDGKRIVTGSWDKTAKIWDTQSGKQLHSLEGHADQLRSASFSPDGNLIVTSSYDKTIKIWDAQNGELLRTLAGHTGFVNSASFSPDGKTIVTASGDQTAKLWDMQSGKLLHTFTGHTSDVNGACFSPDGKSIITASNDKTAKVWEVQSGKLFHNLIGDSVRVNTLKKTFIPSDKGSRASFSHDGKYIVTSANDNTTKLWDMQSGMLLHLLEGNVDLILNRNYDVTFGTEDRGIVLTRHGNTAKIWGLQSGKLLLTLGHADKVKSASLSPDGKTILTISGDNAAKMWDRYSGKLLHNLEAQVDWTFSPILDNFNYSPDGNFVVTTFFDNTAKIWEAHSGKLLHSLEGQTSWVHNANFSPDGNNVLVSSMDNNPKIWDLRSGKLLHNLEGHANITNAKFSPDGKRIITASWDRSAKIWDTQSGKLLLSLEGHSSSVKKAIYTPDGRRIATISGYFFPNFSAFVFHFIEPDKTLKIWDAESGTLLKSLDGHIEMLDNILFSPDGKIIASTEFGKTAKIWDVQTGKLLLNVIESDFFSGSSFSPDSKNISTSTRNETKIWDVETGKLLVRIDGHGGVYSPTSNIIVTRCLDSTAKIWNAKNGNLVYSLVGHRAPIHKVAYSEDGKSLITFSYLESTKIWDANSGKLVSSFELNAELMDISWLFKRIVAANNSFVYLIDLQTGKEIIKWATIGKEDWVVTHPSGLFDASPGAMDKLYFVQGLDIIDFNQLKERYYEPGLWKKVMAGEPLRNVTGFKSIALPPDIKVGQVDDKGFLNITLTNRGGGIGEVNVFVNGKEVIKDARDASVKPDASSASLKVFVGKHQSIVKGQENLIAVKAWNKDHWVQSRGQIVSYHSKEIEQYKPAVHILTCGVSDYTGIEIDLKYAAKDANDVSVALQLGAKKLFGAERSYVYNLTTTQAKEFYPTKTNILKSFEKISSTAHPLDVFVMYLSGHGINYGGQDGDWHYLTQEAYTGNATAYNDPAIRAQTTISSNELVELFKKVPALKQVLMLDACASGKVVDNLMAQKDIESSTLRALDRMRDRTGMHIITGCTADAVSYEASKYGQGVLTYSLLEGIRGAALREDKYVDVNKLFQYAQDRVPQLAEGIGGIQSPQVFSPQGSQSFDIGLLSDVEKKEIPIAKIKPVYIRSNFQDERKMIDVLGLGKSIDQSLNEVSTKGIDAPIIFVDVSEYPDACQLFGRYKKENETITLNLLKKCGEKEVSHELKANDLEGLKKEILKVL